MNMTMKLEFEHGSDDATEHTREMSLVAATALRSITRAAEDTGLGDVQFVVLAVRGRHVGCASGVPAQSFADLIASMAGTAADAAREHGKQKGD